MHDADSDHGDFTAKGLEILQVLGKIRSRERLSLQWVMGGRVRAQVEIKKRKQGQVTKG